MKKITGKVVSLVLALALVVTSFSANFAFASTKKTLSGTVSDTQHDDIYLVNGDEKTVNLNDWLLGSDLNLETKDHKAVTGVEIKAISHVSGDKLVSGSIKDDKAELKLKGKTGKEVVSVLYQGDYSDDDNDYTVKGKANLTVHVYDKGDIVFGEAKDSNYSATKVGKGLDDFETFAQNKNSEKKIGIYKAVQTTGSALADFADVKLVTAKEAITLATGDSTDNVYYYEMTSGEDDVHVANYAKDIANSGSAFDSELDATIGRGTKDSGGKYPTDAKTGNVTINVKKLSTDKSNSGKYKPSSDSDDKYTLKTKVEKKIDVSVANVLSSTGNYTIKKDGSTTKLFGGADAITVKDYELVFPTGTQKVSVEEKTNVKKVSGTVKTLVIGDGKVDSVDLDNGDVDVTDGKVGSIKTDADTGNFGRVEVTGGTVGNIDTTDVDDADAGTVSVSAGTVGDIKSDDKVTIKSDDEDEAVTTGAITAPELEAFADDGKLNIKSIKSTKDNGTFLLKGEKLTAGSIDLDYYDTTVQFGDDADNFVGKLVAPLNSKNGKINTENEDTDVTLTGTVSADTISVGTDSKIAFDGNITVKTIDGDGAMKIAAGKLYVSEGVSSVKLKLSDATLTPGTTVFKADKDAVDVDDFDTFGFTLDKSTGNDVDTFKLKTLSFAGPAINKTSVNIAKGYSETFTASAYPNGTSLPTGATIKWELDGGSSDVFKLTTTGNTAKVEVISLDTAFASENKTTLTATLYDADGDEMDDYDVAKCEITATAVPDATSDTTKDFSVAKGSSYQFKITSATAPAFTTGTASVFGVALVSHTGNDYFYKITATGNVGASTGIYLNGVKLLVATVKAPAFTTDTTKDVTVKGSYTLKVTATATPTFALGTAGVFKAAFVSKTGNDYLYKITSVGKAGAKTGVYVNGVKTFVATVG
nr:hypothetical protein [uncultured Caproiciproducens sp.]